MWFGSVPEWLMGADCVRWLCLRWFKSTRPTSTRPCSSAVEHSLVRERSRVQVSSRAFTTTADWPPSNPPSKSTSPISSRASDNPFEVRGTCLARLTHKATPSPTACSPSTPRMSAQPPWRNTGTFRRNVDRAVMKSLKSWGQAASHGKASRQPGSGPLEC